MAAGESRYKVTDIICSVHIDFISNIDDNLRRNLINMLNPS